jgi:hypothetical protein
LTLCRCAGKVWPQEDTMGMWKIRLTEEERARMDRVREARGLRTLAELVRVLLAEEVRRLALDGAAAGGGR